MKHESRSARDRLGAQSVRARRLRLIREFWTVCLPIIAAEVPRWAGKKPSQNYWLHTASGVPNVQFDVWAKQWDAGCSLYIDAGSDRAAWNKAVFDALVSNQSKIEAAFGNRLVWERLDRAGASVVTWRAGRGGYAANRNEWPGIARSIAEGAKRFEAAFGHNIEAATKSASG